MGFCTTIGWEKRITIINDCVNTRDTSIQQIGNSIANPRGFLLRFIAGLIRLFEKKSVTAVIDLLGI